MKIALIILIVIAYSCSPRTRTMDTTTSSMYSDPVLDNPTPTSANGNSSAVSNVTRNEESPTPVSTIPNEIDHCSWSQNGMSGFSSSHHHLGSFTVCKNIDPNKDTEIFIQVQNPITDSQLCIIPTYNSGSRSIYIGEPRCIFVQKASQIYKVNMLKNRSGYSNFKITGVMIMKDKMYQYGYPFGNPYRWMLSVDAYLFCSNMMDAATPDSRYCEAFAKVGQFVYYEFK